MRTDDRADRAVAGFMTKAGSMINTPVAPDIKVIVSSCALRAAIDPTIKRIIDIMIEYHLLAQAQ